MMISVLPINDIPTFEVTDVVTTEGSSAHTQHNLAYNISRGSWFEDAHAEQHYTFEVFVVSHNPDVGVSIFREEPMLSHNGTLTFELIPEGYGNVTLNVTLKDDGGTARGGVDTSIVHFIILVVVPVNQVPSFNLPNVHVFTTEDSGFNNVSNFAVNISRGNFFEDILQLHSFQVDASRVDQDVFVNQSVLISPDGILRFQTLPDANGNTTFNVTLFDNGRDGRNGMCSECYGVGSQRSSVTQIIIEVLPVNDKPTFFLPVRHIQLLEEFVDDSVLRYFHNFSQEMSSGPANENEQTYSFIVQPASSQIPTQGIVNFTSSKSLSELYAAGAEGQLFEPGYSINLTSNGTLSVLLAQFRHGTVNFTVTLADDGSTVNSGMDVSDAIIFQLEVIPVNSRPLFNIRTASLFFNETHKSHIYRAENALEGLWQGGWKEERDQLLSFTITQTYGAVGLGFLTVSCGQNWVGGNLGCSSGSASLDFQTRDSRFGQARYTMKIVDSGGTEFEGIDSSTHEIYVSVLPINDPPSFRLSTSELQIYEDSSCSTDIPTDEKFTGRVNEEACNFDQDPMFTYYGHEIRQFARAISLGPWENGKKDCHPIVCNSSGIDCADIPSPVTGCETQTGKFIVLPIDVQQANTIFASMPTISFDGTMRFDIKRDSHGTTLFNVTLSDSGGLEATGQFLLTVLSLNDAPDFHISQNLTLYEGDGFIERNIITAINAGSSEENDGQKMTFVVQMTNEESTLFVPDNYPGININASNGRLFFSLANESFGTARLQVILKDDGDDELGGISQTLAKELVLSVCPVNNAPTFDLKERVEVLENSGYQVLTRTVTSIKSGPPNERCMLENDYCESQLLTFIVTDLTNPSLFVRAPGFSPEGVLTFTSAPHASGSSVVSVYAQDDGQSKVRTGCEYRGADFSEILRLLIAVVPVNDPPTFTLPWQIICDTIADVGLCTCSTDAGIDDVCSPKGNISTISIPQAAGSFNIKKFASHISPAVSLLSGSVSFFEPLPNENDCADSNHGLDCLEKPHMHFEGPMADPITSSLAFEYAVSNVRYPQAQHQARHIYTVDFETDTVSVFENTSRTTVQLIDRRGDGEDRLRFTGFAAYPSLNSVPKQVEAAAVCGLETFQLNGRYFVASASGCLSLPEYILHDSDVCEKELETHAPCDAARQTISSAVGSWNFASSSNTGDMLINDLSGGYSSTCSSGVCSFSRPRRQEQAICQEKYPIFIHSATIRDSSNKLGAAILTGPDCKQGFAEDWDRPEEETPSISMFLMNNGLVEALQFDGALNWGLLVADDLGRLSHNLPRNALSLEIWFAVTNNDVPFGGLVSLLQDADDCNRGWGLGYGRVQGNTYFLEFTIAVAGNDALDDKLLKVSTQTSFELGTWLHVVATYDGEEVRMYLDSFLMASSQACSNSPCGDILYPISTEFLQCSTPTKFNIGTYDNVATGQKYPHFGAIKSVRIFDRPLESIEISNLFDTYAHELKASPITLAEHWVKQTTYAAPLQTALSPDTTHSLARDAADVLKIRGRFEIAISYRCTFRHRHLHSVSANGTLDSCLETSCNSLACTIPFWKHGFKGAVLGVQRWDPIVGRWSALWERVCISPHCGYSPAQLRNDSWWTYGSARLLHPRMEGTKSIHRFRVESHLFEFDRENEVLNKISSFQENVTTSGDGSDFLVASKLAGASSFTSFKSGSSQFLIASNFWDGAETTASSVIFKLHSNPAAAEIVQTVSTTGARKWQHFSFESCEFAALASFVEGLIIFPWNAHKVSPIDENNVMRFARSAGASAFKQFSIGNKVYLVVSRFFYSGSYAVDSHIYQVEIQDQTLCTVTVSEIQQVHTIAANDVEYMMMDGVHYLAFATNLLNNPLQLFAWSPNTSQTYPWGQGSLTPNFKLAQLVPTKKASSVQHLGIAPHFLIVTQLEDDMIMFRWNGSMFLGPVDEHTLPKDSASGQQFQGTNSQATASFTVMGENTSYLLAGIRMDEQPTSSKSLLWREQREILPQILNGPTSIIISPDGRFVYVSSLHSRSIAGFYRNNVTGGLVYSQEASSVGPWNSIRMIQHMVMSSDGNIYATAYADNSVLVFGRSANGSLYMRQTISDGMRSQHLVVDGLVGAYSLFLSVSGESLYVGSLEDRAVVLFERQADGLLRYVDRIKEGEQLFKSFQGHTDDSTWQIPSYDYSPEDYEKLWSKTPFRVGGNAINRPWTFTAQDLATFTIDGILYMVVAASDVDAYTEGMVSIYKWKGEGFSLLQELRSETGAAAVKYLSRSIGTVTNHFIVVANGFKAKDANATINVFQWDPDSQSFVFDHSLPAPQAGTSNWSPYASSLEYFTIGSGNSEVGFLAVACLWNGETTRIPSMIYRWNPVGSRVIGNQRRSFGTGFEWYQDIQGTMAASDVSFHRLQDGTGLLVVANSQGTSQNGTGRGSASIFEFNATSRTFENIQTLECMGAADVEPFNIPGEGDFLATASRQNESFVLPSALEHRDHATWDSEFSVYDQTSIIWKWDAVRHQFESYQHLGENITTVSDTGDRILDRLRGVTGFKMFTSRGEYFLAVAQSVCDTLQSVGRSECLRHQVQPKSAILQWNRVEKKFGELLSMTDNDNIRLRGGKPIEDDDLNIHSFAMRLSVGRARRWDFVPRASRDLLICISLTKGVLVYTWDFNRVVGMSSIVGLTTDFDDHYIYVVARADNALLAFRRGVIRDDTNHTVHQCPDDRCLVYVETRSENEMILSSLRSVDQYPRTTGLSGALSVKFEVVPGFPRGAIVVNSGLFRDELLCGSIGPVPRNKQKDFGLQATCQDVTFKTKTIFMSNNNLFLTLPFLDKYGTLVFETSPAAVGDARFLLQIQDSDTGILGQSIGMSQEFAIHVIPVNQPPIFRIVQENLRVGEGVETTIVFAENVGAGADEEYGQDMTWIFSHDCPTLFVREPQLSVVSQQGSLVGKMNVAVPAFQMGECNLNVTLADDGISSSNGDRNVSDTVSLVLSVLFRNRGPQFEHLDELRIDTSNQLKVVTEFARVISTGSFDEINQNVSFRMENVTFNGRIVPGLFNSFVLDVNGTLMFQERTNAIGDYVVTLKAEDDGGAMRGGVNATFSSFVLRLVFNDGLRPVIASPGSLEVLEADVAIEKVFKNFFQVANIGNVTRPTSLMITDVSDPDLFLTNPRVDADLSLSFELKPYVFGQSSVTVMFVVGDQTCANGSTPNTCIAALPHVVYVNVLPWNRPPSFHVLDFVGSVEDGGEDVVVGFVSQIVAGPVREAGQSVRFEVQVSSGNENFFAILPQINPVGDLHLKASSGRHGVISLHVIAVDDGALTMDVNTSSAPVVAILKVFPRPRITSVVPKIGPLSGGNTVTVYGMHFGSKYSRGYVSEFYGNISVFVGGGQCANATFISDQAIVCVTPSGVGQSTVSVNISDGTVTRSGFLESGYTHNLFYLGGSLKQPRSAGFVAHSPLYASSGLVGDDDPSIGASDLVAAKTIRALTVFQGFLYAGGDFMSLNVADARFIFAWDGSAVTKLENGVDGSVLCLLSFDNHLVVAGAFTHVFKQWGSVRTGGLAMWDGKKWTENPLGAIVNGVVTNMATNGTNLFIGGRFKNVGSIAADGIAMWDGKVWHALHPQGLSGEVTALTASASLLYLAGTFRSEEETTQVLRWDGGNTGWYSLGEVHGRVDSLLVHAQSLYVAGDFSMAGSVPVANLAVFHAGRWAPLGGGVNGAVNAMLHSNGCLYIGGAFTAIHRDGPNAHEVPASFAARYCKAASRDQLRRLEALESFAGMGAVQAFAHA